VVSRVGVPEPLWAVGNQGNGERIVVVADDENDLAATAFEPVSSIVGGHESLIGRTVGDIVSGPDHRPPFGAEDREERLLVAGAAAAAGAHGERDPSGGGGHRAAGP